MKLKIIFILYKLSRFLYKVRLGFLSSIVKELNLFLFGIEISKKSLVHGGVVFPHPLGVIIGGNSEVGENCKISQGVTLGGNFKRKINGRQFPSIHDNVWILKGAIIVGGVEICNCVIIGPNSVVSRDIIQSGYYAGQPVKLIRKLSNHERSRLGCNEA
jgi:serine O-acetyltransferase